MTDTSRIAAAFRAAAKAALARQPDPRANLVSAALREVGDRAKNLPEREAEWSAAVAALLRGLVTDPIETPAAAPLGASPAPTTSSSPACTASSCRCRRAARWASGRSTCPTLARRPPVPADRSTSRAAVFGAVLAALWAAHDVGDHVVQTDHQAAHKAKDWGAMASHVGGYHAVQVAVLAALRTVGVRPPWWRLAAGVALSAATHALLDRRWPVVAVLRRTGCSGFASSNVVRIQPGIVRPGAIHGEQFAHIPEAPLPLHGPYLADQALHHACLLVAALVIASGRAPRTACARGGRGPSAEGTYPGKGCGR